MTGYPLGLIYHVLIAPLERRAFRLLYIALTGYALLVWLLGALRDSHPFGSCVLYNIQSTRESRLQFRRHKSGLLERFEFLTRVTRERAIRADERIESMCCTIRVHRTTFTIQ